MDSKIARICALNDELRQNFAEEGAVMTPGAAALGAEVVARIVKTIAVFDDFCPANDPHEEHDFGAFEADGHRVFFKVDYYDETLTQHSPDPADPSVTERVITIMLAEEYWARQSGRVAMVCSRRGCSSTPHQPIQQAPRHIERTTTMMHGDHLVHGRDGEEKPVTLEHIVIIAPYNAQVFEIQQRVPEARVGTVAVRSRGPKVHEDGFPTSFIKIAFTSGTNNP